MIIKKVLVVISGLVLVLLGAFGIFGGFTGAPNQWVNYVWVIIGILFVVSGLSIFSFYQWTRILAIISYSSLLLFILSFIIFGYFLALGLTNSGAKPDPYSIKNILGYIQCDVARIPLICLFINICFIVFLSVNRKIFK